MFAVGHFALGYLTGKVSSTQMKAKLNLPLLLVVSILPDFDLLLQIVNPTSIMHRGPTHSIIVFTVLMIPFFLFYRKQAIPYYVVLLSHSVVGDFLTGGVELLWPLSHGWFGGEYIAVGGLTDVVVEFILFAVSLTVMVKMKDLQTLFRPKKINLVLVVCVGALLGPVLAIGHPSEMTLPILLLGPSLFWLFIFAYSILRGFMANNQLKTLSW